MKISHLAKYRVFKKNSPMAYQNKIKYATKVMSPPKFSSVFKTGYLRKHLSDFKFS